MDYILVLIIILLVFVAFFIGEKDITSPWIIVCGIFLISSLVAAINRSIWGTSIDSYTVIIIVSALVCFGLGQYVIQYFFYKSHFMMTTENETNTVLRPSRVFVSIICFAMIIMFLYYANQLYKLSLSYGNNNGFKEMIYYVRTAIVDGGDINKIANHFQCLCQCIAYIFATIFCKDLIYSGLNKQNIIYCVPTIIYIPFLILKGERTGFIYLIVFVFIIGAFFSQRKSNGSIKTSIKIVLAGCLGLFLFFIVFRLSGFLKQSGVGVSAFESISKYTGFSIPAFDEFLKNPFPENTYFGEYTLNRIYSITNQLHLTNIPLSSRYLPFLTLPNGTSANVYTALARYIQDFGYLGMYITMLCMGIIYSCMWKLVKKIHKIDLGVIFYAMFFYPLALISIDDVFFNEFVSTTTVYQIIYTAAVYYLIVKNVKCKKA